MQQTNEDNLSKIFNQFHLFESSSDLPNKIMMKIKRFINQKDFTINDVKLNFLQTVKLSILKNTNT